MTITRNKELIEKYLSQEMNTQEMKRFESLLKQNQVLAEEFKLQFEIFEAIKDTGKIKLRHTLNEVHQSRTKIWMLPVFNTKIRSIAAILIVALVAGGFLVTNYLTNGVSDKALYSQYFNPEEALLAVRSIDGSEAPIEAGMKYYQEKNYNEAIESFLDEPGNLLGKLYSGFSLMQLERYDEAEGLFNDVINDNDNLLIDQAEWNLGLCYMISGKTDAAKELFTKISTGNTVYNIKALELLTKMGDNN